MTVEHTYGRDTRTWIAVEPVPAANATDPAIPLIRVVADRLLALGYCPDGDAYGDASLWRIRPGRTGQAAVTRLNSAHDASLSTGSGRLYPPPARAASWPPGRYAVQIPQPRGRGPAAMWFAVELVAAPPLPRR